MANGFEFEQVDKAYWNNDVEAWVYRFRIVNTEYAADFVLTFGVADSVPEQDRLAEAKNYLRAFVATLSSELKGF